MAVPAPAPWQTLEDEEYNFDLVCHYHKDIGGYKADIHTLPSEEAGQLGVLGTA